MTENDTKYKALFRELLSNVSATLDEPQDYLGLDAGGFLLIALGHLVKAREELDKEPPSRAVYKARNDTIFASNSVRHALKLLDEQKEETCEKSWTDSERQRAHWTPN